jgi:hypothetical protein
VVHDRRNDDLIGGTVVPGDPSIVGVQNDGRSSPEEEHGQEDQHGARSDAGECHIQLESDDLGTAKHPGGCRSETTPQKLAQQAERPVGVGRVLASQTVMAAGGG